jgi:hypothetical protein
LDSLVGWSPFALRLRFEEHFADGQRQVASEIIQRIDHRL